MRIPVIVALGLSLAACGTVANPLTQNQLYDAEAAYGVALSAMKGYRTACVNHVPSVYPTCRTVVPKLQAAVRDIQGNLATARSFIRQNPTLTPTVVVSAVMNSLAELQRLEAQYGVTAFSGAK